MLVRRAMCKLVHEIVEMVLCCPLQNYKYSRVSFYDGVTFSNIWLWFELS